MRLRLVIMIAVALAVAGGAAYVTHNWLRAERQALARQTVEPAEPPEQLTAKVLVAAEELPAGKIIKTSNLRWQPWPEDGLSESYTVHDGSDSHDLVGAVVRQPLAAGEPVTDSRVVRPGDRGFLAAMLGEGKRAITVAVTATSGLSGLIFPGDRVDVILTHIVPKEQSATGTKRRASETVLHDIRVLALDQRTEDLDGKRVVAKTATLELTPKQAEKIALAEQLGSLSLSLRPVAKKEDEEAPPPLSLITDNQLSAVVTYPRRSEPKKQTVTVVRGGSRGGVDARSFAEE